MIFGKMLAPTSGSQVRSGSHFRNLVILPVVFAAISGLFISVSSIRFRFPALVVVVHILVVLGLLLGSLLAAAALRAVWRTGQWLTVLPPGLFATALLELYLFNALGWMVHIDSISIQLLGYYLPHVFGNSAALSSIPYYLLFVPLAAIPLLMFAIFRSILPVWFGSISWVVDPEGKALFGRTRIALHASISLLIYGCLLVFLVRAGVRSGGFRGEPVLAFFRPVRPTTGEIPRTFYDRSQCPPGEDVPFVVSRDAHRKNVVIILVDALRANHLRRFGYSRDTMPLLSARMRDAPVLEPVWATSACPVSECGILAILSSRPYQRLNAGLFSLPEALYRAGYRTYFDMSGDFTVAYRALRTLASDHAQLFADGFSDDRYHAYDDHVILRALNRIPGYSDTPAFFYFHLHSVHIAGVRFQPVTWTPTVLNIRNALKPHFTGLTADREIVTNNYDNGIRQADSVVDQILSNLQRKGYLDHSVVVITADHGEPLGEHGAWQHGGDLYAESIDIPMIFIDTDLHASRSVPYATQLDLAPTIADLVGIPVPAQWEGTSLLETVPDISIAQTTSARPIEAVIWRQAGASYKYLFDVRHNTEKLFELRTDPREQLNLIAKAEPALLAFLRGTRARRFEEAPVHKP